MSKRKRNGSSVLFVATMGFLVLLAVMAVTDSLVSAQRNVNSQVNMNEASSAAENSLQYAVALLNAAAANGTLATITSPITIPASITGNATVSVTMTPLTATQVQYPLGLTGPQSAIYNPTTSPPPDYRFLSAQAQVGSYQRTINVMLGEAFRG